MQIFKLYKILIGTALMLLNCSLFSQEAFDYSKKCRVEMQKGEFVNALASVNKAIDLDSSKADYFLLKATVLFDLEKYEEAIKYCHSTFKIEPENFGAFFLRGQICLVTGSFGGAVFFFKKIIDFSKDDNLRCKAYTSRAKVNIKLGKYIEANADLVSANKITKDSIGILLPLAESYFRMNQIDSATKILGRILLVKSDCLEALKMMGNISFEKKDYPLAVSYLNHYILLNPKDADVYNRIAEAYFQQKDYSNAFVSVYRAIHLDPNESVYYKTLAYINIDRGESEELCNNLFHAFQLGYLEKYGYDLLEIYLKNCEHKQ